jgi:hypothetical protein
MAALALRIIKWAVLCFAGAWAMFAMNGIIALSDVFPQTAPPRSDFLATLQTYAVVFGPAIIAAFFLMIRWPENVIGKLTKPMPKAPSRK